jgi:hypothetical protein
MWEEQLISSTGTKRATPQYFALALKKEEIRRSLGSQIKFLKQRKKQL